MYRFFVVIFIFCVGQAWSSGRIDEQLWSDVYLTHGNEKLEIQHRIGNRLNLNNCDNYLGHYRIRATLGSGLLKYRLGTAFFYAHESKSESVEIRPWGGFYLNIPIGNIFQFRNYVRLENRFVSEDIDDFNSFSDGRIRYRFGMNSKLFQNENNMVSLVLLPEMLVDLGAFNSFNYNELRLMGGLKYTYNNTWIAGVNLIRQLPQYNAIDFDVDYSTIFQLTLKRRL